ncbi:MAG: HD domain-containing protein [Actinomycetota bacterium]|nr:HD domain-containing protein [Actinomycetota bacterium]
MRFDQTTFAPTDAVSGGALAAAAAVPTSTESSLDRPRLLGTPEIISLHPLAVEILDGHRAHALGDDEGYRGYRGHVYRVLNFARALSANIDDRDAKLAIAAAFHDLDAFSALDYLSSSIRAQDAWLRQTGRQAWASELAVVIAEHHRLTPYRGPHAPLAEAFRRADLVDLSQGLIRDGIPRPYVKAVRAAFDVGSFFTRVVPRAIVRNLRQHPLDPFPHMRARRALATAGHTGAEH